LRGVVYYGEHHFTCRYLDEYGSVWFHDGLATGRHLICETDPSSVELASCGSRRASLAVYIKESAAIGVV
ncbi:hypothetical protein FPV67DRAFT_1412876, partial [Lyophyllum atratum]